MKLRTPCPNLNDLPIRPGIRSMFHASVLHIAASCRSRWAFLSLIAVLTAGALVACGQQAAVYPIIPTDELVARGRSIYTQKCASCHGDATTPPPLKAAPSHAADGHTWHHQDRLLVQWILDGAPLATTMPKWRGTLTEGDALAVVAYIKTFWPEEIRQRQIEGSAEYEVQIREDQTAEAQRQR